MTRKSNRQWPVGVAAILAVVALLTAWTMFVGAKDKLVVQRRPAGYPQLVSVKPFPEMDGEMCQWVPASAQTPLRVALRQERLAAQEAATSSPDPAARVNVNRGPARIIRDTNPTFSGVAVDPIRNEIVAQDENMFQLMVFDRLANTPPTANFTEPKRVIAGPSTTLEFECGIYIDPKTGDIYSLANDVGDRLAVFSREAKGDVPPNRVLNTRHGIGGIAVNEENGEMYLSSNSSFVVVYNKYAQGDDKPLRTIEGPNTRLGSAYGIALDTKRKLMFVANHGNYGNDPDDPKGARFEPSLITVYPLDADGDVAPIQVIQGPKSQLNWPALMYADSERGELYVANDGDHSILVFSATANGDVAPIRVIRGPKTGFMDTKNDELVVSNLGNHSITVFSRTANGDVEPLRTIRSAPKGKLALTIVNPGGIAFDTKRNEILTPN